MRIFLVYTDDSFCEARFTISGLERLQSEWESFIKLNIKSREVIAETLADLPGGIGMVRHHIRKFAEVYPQYTVPESNDEKLDEVKEQCGRTI
jgi:hypothetical protein